MQGERSAALVLSIDALAGLDVTKPAFKGGVVEGKDCQIACSPVNIKSSLWTTAHAAITANAVTSQPGIGLQGDIVGGTFIDAPAALIAARRVWFRFWQHSAQKAICTEEGYKVIESTSWLEGIRAATGNRTCPASRDVFDDGCGEALRQGKIVRVGTIREATQQTRSWMMRRSSREKAADDLSSFGLQQVGQVKENASRCSTRSGKDKGALVFQCRQVLQECFNRGRCLAAKARGANAQQIPCECVLRRGFFERNKPRDMPRPSKCIRHCFRNALRVPCLGEINQGYLHKGPPDRALDLRSNVDQMGGCEEG